MVLPSSFGHKLGRTEIQTPTTMYVAKVSPVPSSFFSLKNKKKGSGYKDDYDLISRSFDEYLLCRLKTLAIPPPPPASSSISISLSWLSMAVDFLSFMHSEAATLLSNLKLSAASSLGDDSLTFYLEDSVKILDLCNSISAEIECLRHRRMRLNFFLHLLANSPAPDKLKRARDSIISDSDIKFVSFKSGRAGFEARAEDLVKDLASRMANTQPGKLSGPDKVVRHTIHAVGTLTVFVARVVFAALRGSVPAAGGAARAEFSWADSFNGLESAIRTELTRRFGGDIKNVNYKNLLAEFDEVETRVKEVCEVIDEVAKEETDKKDKEMKLNGAGKELERAAESFSEGLDCLFNGVNRLFNTVMCTRKDILEKISHEKKGTKM